MAALPESRRAGLPWGVLRGADQELNEIAKELRTWLDDAGITVAALHGRLTPDHFPDGVVPAQRKLYDFCAGKDLTWAFVEAVADACTPGDAPAQEQKLSPVRQMWETARTNPSALGGGGELMEAKDRVIAAYERIYWPQSAAPWPVSSLRDGPAGCSSADVQRRRHDDRGQGRRQGWARCSWAST
ncbi:hypothetical protein [Streptomyces violaceusniger]|uniref:Uncharacterized protein n=1 Tax=Streptomyces violaceusniger TaxID=68280 RepID=A0A4D4LFC5_STRVO|nr:hypothetical protein SVIO_109740 [Streptomyces violaceusniger]